jgi:hypothetical protein
MRLRRRDTILNIGGLLALPDRKEHIASHRTGVECSTGCLSFASAREAINGQLRDHKIVCRHTIPIKGAPFGQMYVAFGCENGQTDLFINVSK